MIFKNLPFGLALTLLAALIVGCGDQNNSNHLTKEDVAYIKQKRYQEMYGGGTSTVTNTVSITTTVTISTTVNAN